MALLRNIFQKYSKQILVSVFAVIALSLSFIFVANVVEATLGPGSVNPPVRPTGPGGLELRGEADVYGFAWMGTGISDPNTSQGGGGWLKFNCEPEYCTNRTWGVKINLEPGSQLGKMSGEAWSNNLGFLVFDDATVSSCWQNYPSAWNNVATVTNLDIADTSYGNFRKVAGWAKFLAGDDTIGDGWDGCVNFNGGESYGVKLDLTTGDLTGWAWGGPVVGWISFKNPECRFCDTSVTLPSVARVDFWAQNTVVPQGGSTILRWEAIDTPQKRVVSCNTYSNSSNYTHWRSTGGDSTNVGAISTVAGNLPIGSHPINNINQTTTYRINCQASDGTSLPQRTATVTVVDAVQGCMDDTASNYNPQATIPGDCTYDTGAPTVSLVLVTGFTPNNTLPVGSQSVVDYNVSPRWTFTNPSRVAACTGEFYDDNDVPRSLNGWTNGTLAVPTASNGYYAGPHSGVHNVHEFATLPTVGAGDTFSFKILCTDIDGNNFGDGNNVVFRNTSTPTTTLNLDVEEDIIVYGSGDYDTGTISWTSGNTSIIAPNSCVGTFRVNNVIQSLSGWTGSRPNPNFSISGFDLSSIVSTLPVGVTPIRFTITCQSNNGTTIPPASDTINVQRNAPPAAPIPVVDLVITNPDNNYGSDYELLPVAGAPVTISWSVQNATSCVGTSSMYNQGANGVWDGNSFAPSSGSIVIDMTQSSFYYHPSLFTLTCVNDDNVSASDSVNVVIEDYDCPIGSPECPPAPGSNIPGYEEF
ncbi:MAG: hypothetical protein R3B39_00290 [Candidatus Paceibacterota bacterium]